MKMMTETADPLPHWLPVLLMFLKLPKLFNFHILRLAAEREISKEEDRQGLRRRKIFSQVLVRAGTGTGTGDGGRTFCLPGRRVPFLVHALLPPVLLPVAHGGGLAGVLPGERTGRPFQGIWEWAGTKA